MAIPIGIAIAKTAANIGVGFLNKPKRKHYRPDLSYLDKYVANLRGDMAKRTVERNILREGSKAIGDMSRDQTQQADYQAHQTGMVGSGLHVAQKQKIGQTAQTAMADVTTKAMGASAEHAQRTEEAIRQVELQKDHITQQAKEDYNRAKSQWKTGMYGKAIEGAVDIGGAAVMSGMEARDATAMAQAQGGLETPEMARQALIDTGAATWTGRLQALGVAQDRQQGNQYVTALVETMGLVGVPGIQEILDSDKYTPTQKMELISATSEFHDTEKGQEIATDFIEAEGQGNPWDFETTFINVSAQFPDKPLSWKQQFAQSLHKTPEIIRQEKEQAADRTATTALTEYGRDLYLDAGTAEFPVEALVQAGRYKELISHAQNIAKTEGEQRAAGMTQFVADIARGAEMGDYTVNDINTMLEQYDGLGLSRQEQSALFTAAERGERRQIKQGDYQKARIAVANAMAFHEDSDYYTGDDNEAKRLQKAFLEMSPNEMEANYPTLADMIFQYTSNLNIPLDVSASPLDFFPADGMSEEAKKARLTQLRRREYEKLMSILDKAVGLMPYEANDQTIGEW